MKITIINGSPRKQGNTEIMVDAFIKGALEAGHQVKVMSVVGKEIRGCIGCEYCVTHAGQCVQKDAVAEIVESTNWADMVVFASPIYWNFLTGQLTTVINRLHGYGDGGFHFTKAALLLNAAVDSTFEIATRWYLEACEYQGWKNMGVIAIGGMEKKGSMKSHPRLQEVYTFGKSL